MRSHINLFIQIENLVFFLRFEMFFNPQAIANKTELQNYLLASIFSTFNWTFGKQIVLIIPLLKVAFVL